MTFLSPTGVATRGGEKRTGRTTPRKTKRALEGTTDGAFFIERKRVERLDNNEEEKKRERTPNERRRKGTPAGATL